MLYASTVPAPTLAPSPIPDRAPAVTRQELRVLSLVVDGLTNTQIAARLHNSPRTVQSHVRSLMRKFAVRSRTQLAVAALRAGFVPLHAVGDVRGTVLPVAA